jgi:hypothetical protein
MTSNVPPIATRSNDSIKELCVKIDYSFSYTSIPKENTEIKRREFYLPVLLAVIANQ